MTEPVKLTKVLDEAYAQAVEEAGNPESPGELDRIWRSVNRSPAECGTGPAEE